MSEGLSFTLSLGGVDFCLSPLDNGDDSSIKGEQCIGSTTKSLSRGGHSPIVSVRRGIGMSAGGAGRGGGGEIVAELAGFSGTLRISLSSSNSESARPPAALAPQDASCFEGGVDSTGFALAGAAKLGDDGFAPAVAPFVGEHLDTPPIVEGRGSGKQKDARESKWKSRGKQPRHGLDRHNESSVDGRPSNETRISSAEGSFSTIDEGGQPELGALDKTNSIGDNRWTDVVEVEAGADLLRRATNESDSVATPVSATPTASSPFQKLLRHTSDDIPPPAPASSPLHGRDRPFKTGAFVAMVAGSPREAGIDVSTNAVKEDGCRVADGVTTNENGAAEASSKRQMSALALGDDFSDDNALSGVTLGARARGASDSAKNVLILGPRSPRITITRSTPLHLACANSNVTLSRLRSILESDTGAAFVKNERGKLPIHIIAENESLLQYQRRREDVGTFIRDLCDVFPMGIITEDDGGNVPLTPILRHWIQNTYQAVYRSSTAKSAVESEKSTLRFVLGFARYSRHRALGAPMGKDNEDRDRSNAGTDRMPSLTDGPAGAGDTRVFDRLFPDVYAPPIVEWVLVMLSLALDNFGGPLSRERGTRSEQLARRQALAERVATIPLFLKTILLIEDSETRNRLLELSIVRRALLCSTTVDQGWIVGMLKKRGTPSLRCVDYFTLVSKLDISDYIGKDRGPQQADYTSFQRELRALFDAIQKFDEILPSLLILPKKDLEQVSRSKVVWQVLNETISRPFVIGIVMIDFVLHLTLILAFRADIAAYTNTSGDYVAERETIIVMFCIGLHQLLRKASEGIYLFLISPAVCWHYFLDFWTIVDLLSIAFVWFGAVYFGHQDVDAHSNLMAVTMALLWFRLLGLLKAINMHLATFILSITEIVKDIKWYLLLMAICIIMFADMIHIITSSSNNGEYCEIDFDEEESRTREDFCSRNLLHSYLRMYAVLAGDFEFDDYRTTPFISFLFVLFILLGVIVLLNVLIAIVSDSYEKSCVRSAYLFGRARIGFAAEHAALESFLMRPRKKISLSDFSIGRTTQFLVMCGRIGRWSILLSLVGTAVATDLFLVSILVRVPTVNSDAHTGLVIAIFILAFILNIAVLDILRFLFRGCSCCRLHLFVTQCKRNEPFGQSLRQRTSGLLTNVLDRCLSFIAEKLFGINLKQEDGGDDDPSEWEGRLDYINQQTSRIVRQSELQINEKVKQSERRIQEYDRATKEELQRDISNVLQAVVRNR